MNKMVSIIVPVYNVENYLRNCILSLINQEYNHLEIILVDDGSTDLSLAICKEYEAHDNRIKVLQKINGGQSSARNLGLDIAQGDFVTFVDSDDTVSTDFLSKNMAKFSEYEDLDLLQYPVYYHYGASNAYIRNQESLYIKQQDFWSSWLKDNKISWIMCDKIFNRRLFDNLRFREGMVYEDNYLMVDIIQNIKSCYISDKGLYYYHERDNSTTTSQLSVKKEKDTHTVLSHILDQLDYIIHKDIFLAYVIRLINVEKSLFHNFKVNEFSSKLYMKRIKIKDIVFSSLGMKEKIKLMLNYF